MLPLLLAALGAPGAAPFVLQVASWCSLATNGSLVATNDSQWLQVALSQQPLLCGDLRGPRARPCPGQGGPLVALGDILGRVLERDPRWGRRLSRRMRVCGELPAGVWPPASAPPQLRILPERSGPALSLTCHAWGFTPAGVTLRWLRDGDPAGDARAWPRPLPAGDGTFRAQVTVPVAPGAGESWECVALGAGLEEPVSVTWAPGMSPRLSLLVALAALAMGAGLLLFALGLRRYLRPGSTFLPGRARAGYTPLPGDTYAGGI